MTARETLMLTALLSADILSGLELTMIYAAMPTLTRTFGYSPEIMWLVSAGLLVGATSAALCGRLGDLYGRKRVLLIVMALAALGSVIAALAGALPVLIAGTAIQGVAGAILPLSLAIVREQFSEERVPFIIGLVMASSAVAAIAGLVLGGAIIDHFGWQGIFVVSAGFAAVALLAVRLFVPTSAARNSERGQVDMLRGVLFAPAIMMLLLAITKLKDWGWQDGRFVGLAAAALAVLILWWRHQLRQTYPLINVRLIATRGIGLAYLCIGLMGLGAMQHTLIMSMYLQQPAASAVGFGLSATMAGYAMMPVRLLGCATSPLGGRLVQIAGARSVLVLAMTLTAAGWATIMLFMDVLPLVILGMILEGGAFFVAYVAISSAIVQMSPAERVGEASGAAVVFRAAAASIGAQVVAQLLAAAPVVARDLPGSPMPSRSSFLLAFGFILATCVMTAIAGVFLPRRATSAPASAPPAVPLLVRRSPRRRLS